MKTQPFNQTAPELNNQFDDDMVLQDYLERMFPAEQKNELFSDLRSLGAACLELDALVIKDRLIDPVLTQWDAWGQRIDHIELTDTWKRAREVAATHGVVAAAYEGRFGVLARVHQFSLAYLFAPASDFYGCPLAMTDGAARTLLSSDNRALIDRAVPHLTSRDPEEFWTSGQWMTESTGGSDVGLSETIAHDGEEGWQLSGRKWFTSAATSQMALTLARPEGNPAGGHGLALFYVECEHQRGKTILTNRLKDKLGTRKVPTAELTLDDADATLVLGTSGGVKGITPMLNVTRTWNAVTSAALMRRGLALAKDYARRRHAFGATLNEKPLHADTLAGLSAEYEGAFLLAFRVAELLGRHESGDAASSDLLRVLTPVAKLTTGRQVVQTTSEVLEAFGGAGYVEDTGLPRLLRDAQVLSIWEGTTNVLALDLLRAIHRGAGLTPLHAEIKKWVVADDDSLRAAGDAALRAFEHALAWLSANQNDQASLEAGARRFALTIGRSTELALLVDHARWALGQGKARPRAAALRFAKSAIDQIQDFDPKDTQLLAQ